MEYYKLEQELRYRMGKKQTLEEVANFLCSFTHRPNVVILHIKDTKIIERIPFKGCMCHAKD